MRPIYMDANATTPLLPEVLEAMHPYFIERFGNPSSIHRAGQHARAAVEAARESVSRMLSCRPAEIVFTSGGTEADNLALFGVLQPFLATGERPHLVTTAIEHHAVLHAAEALAARGCEVTFLTPTPSGLIEPAALAAALRPGTRLVSIMLANNETGIVQPVAELAELAHAAGALFHTDAVQAASKLPLDLSGHLREVDLLSLSGHKMYAPHGTGILFVRRKTSLTPLFYGGAHERQRRAGTENLPGIVALGCAASLASRWLEGAPEAAVEGSAGPSALAGLRDRLESSLLAAIPQSGVNGAGAPRVPNTANLFFSGVDAEALVIALDLKGLAVSGGSACTSGATEPSHVLRAMGLSDAHARASIRLSLSRLTTAEEVDRALALIPQTVAHLRSLAR